LIVLIIVPAGSVVKARSRETIKREMKACSLSLVVRIIIRIILIRTRSEITAAFMAGKTD
jgi:hypothetical protein